MKNFKEDFYKILINKENFYMKQYYSDFYKEEVFLAVKELRDGIYCVLISRDERKDTDYSEAIRYVKALGKSFSLNMIILSDKEYACGNESLIPNKLIINEKNYKVISCDNSCAPLEQIFNSTMRSHKINNSRKKERFLEDKILTLFIISINGIMFLITQFEIYSTGRSSNEVLISLGAKYNLLIENGEVWRLLTCAFLHSGIIHIGCNMYSLYIIGPQIHQIYGAKKYFIIYIISCITSSLLSYLMSPYSISVGASGGIFGLMGALLAFAIIEREKIEKKYLSSLLQIIIINLFIGLSIKNIDNFGHIGGLIGGMLIGYIIYRTSKNKRIL
ncbi:rhomboid protease GluP [Clostridium puniceum]|uniref:Rhomboid protease GluP n=1 Tax=Clostridium puniceum TaxID=29367 RepID=A0A1S8T9E2_9CLOT|nr:rhomboid family intramembrane serine protease [Clostridium puniceum]OOM74376.1 rhomboid protease GluP [Clostridium puniceum]